MAAFYQVPPHETWILQGDVFRGVPVDRVVFEDHPVVKSITDTHVHRSEARRTSRLVVIASNSCDVSEEEGRVVQEIVVAQLRPIGKFHTDLKAIGGVEAMNASRPAEYVRFFHYPKLDGVFDEGLLADFSQMRTVTRSDLNEKMKVAELEPETQKLFMRRLALHFSRPNRPTAGAAVPAPAAPSPTG
jgi:hypothetical protein